MTEIRPMIRLQGLPAAQGIAIGQAVVIANRALDVFRIPIAADETDAEVSRFKSACSVTQQQIQGTRAKASHLFGQELAAIFDAHSLLLSDRMFLDQVERRIVEEQVNAEWAVHETSRELAKRFSAIENPYLRERGQDLEDIGRQLLRVLQGIAHHEISDVSGNVILVADDLVPSEAIRLGRDKVIGFAIEAGGRTSHTSIIARSLGLPAVTGLEEVTDYVTNSDPVIVDGSAGIVILHPTPEVLAEYERRRDEISAAGPATPESRESAPVTADGVAVELMVNIDLPEELPQLGRLGARGIGLYRSEFLYMETDPHLPSEEDHLQLYLKLIEAAAPFPAVVRTYDLGGRKLAREMMDSAEENPVLGLRGIRLDSGPAADLPHPDPGPSAGGGCRRPVDHGADGQPGRGGRGPARGARGSLGGARAGGRSPSCRGAGGNHGRGSGGGDHRRQSGQGGRFHGDRNQRLDPVFPGGRPQQPERRRPVRAGASGHSAHATLHHRERGCSRHSGQPVRRNGGGCPAPAAPRRPGAATGFRLAERSAGPAAEARRNPRRGGREAGDSLLRGELGG